MKDIVSLFKDISSVLEYGVVSKILGETWDIDYGVFKVYTVCLWVNPE